MKKVKIMSSYDYAYLEKVVNAFISEHGATSIQFQTTGDNSNGKTYAVMIVYEED